MAKYNPTTKDWQALHLGGDEIHDLQTDGSWYYYVSGCTNDGDSNHIRKYDFTGVLEWEKTFGNECRHTTLAVDGLYDIYVSGTFSTENGYGLTLGDIELPIHILFLWTPDMRHSMFHISSHTLIPEKTVWRKRVPI